MSRRWRRRPLPVIVDRYVETLEEVANASRSGRATRR